MEDKMSKEDMVKEAVEEAKAKAAMEAEEVTGCDECLSEADCKEDDAADDMTEDVREESLETPEDEASKDSGTDSGDEKNSSPKEKKRFGRKPKKDKKDEKIEELTDRLTRQMAEFDNFRKRTDKEKSQMYEVGAKNIIEKILPVVDNFERGLAAVPEEEASNPFVQGMDKIYKQLMTTLEEVGVMPIEAIGNEFNPDYHNAVMHVEDGELEENIVAEEFQKGYTYRDSVVRHSMVKVAN